MAENMKLAQVDVDVVGRTEKLDEGFRRATRQAESEAKKMGRALARGVGGAAGAGGDAADNIIKGLTRRFDTQVADAREEMFGKLISPEDFKRRSATAAAEFNKGIQGGLRRLAASGQLTPELHQKLVGEFKDMGLEAGKGFSGKLQGWLFGIKGMIAGIAGFIAIRIGKALYSAGTAAEEAGTKFEAVFGQSAAAARAFLEDYARMLGLTQGQAENLMSTQAAIAQGMGMNREASREFSEAVVRLAGDLGSFHNLGVEEVLTKIRSGITGEFEPLKQLGIVLKQADVEMKALTMTGKKHADELTKAERATAALALITDQAGVAVGDLERTMGGTANTGRRVGAIFAQWKEDVGVGATQVFGEFLSTLEEGSGIIVGTGKALKWFLTAVADFIGGVKILANEATGAILGVPARVKRMLADDMEAWATWVDKAGGILRHLGINISGDGLRSSAARFRREADETLAMLRDSTDRMNEEDATRRGGITPEAPINIDDDSDLQRQKRLAEEAEKLAERQRALQERLTTELGRLAADATEEQLRQLRKLEEEWIATYGSIDQATAASFARLRANVEAGGALAKLQEGVAALGEMAPGADALAAHEAMAEAIRAQMVTVEQGTVVWGQYEALLKRVEAQAEGMRLGALTEGIQGEFSRTMTEARIALERGALSKKAFEKIGKEAAKAFNEGLLAILETVELTPAQREAIAALLKGDAGPEGDSVQRLRDQARAFEENAQAAVSFANTLGIIDDETANVLNSMVQLGTSIARVAGGDLTAIPALLASAASLFKGLFGGSDAAEKARRQIFERNTDAIEELTRELRGFRVTAENLTGARRAVSGALSDPFFGMMPFGGNSDRTLTVWASKFGLTLDELEAIAEEYGITIRNSSGQLIRGGLRQLEEALGIAAQALVGFRDTVDDQRSAAELEADIRDETVDAGSKLRRELDLLARFAPDMFGKFLAGIDPTTPEGRAALNDALLKLFQGFSSGKLNLENLTRDEFLDILRELESALDEATATGGVTGGDGSTRLSVAITELQANQLLQIESTQLHLLQTYLPQIAAALTGGRISATGMPTGAATQVLVDMSGLEVTIQAAGGVGDASAMAGAGRAAGEALADGFSTRLRTAWRAAGATEGVRLNVTAKGENPR